MRPREIYYCTLTFVATASLTLREPKIDAAQAKDILCSPALGEAQRVAVGAGRRSI